MRFAFLYSTSISLTEIAENEVSRFVGVRRDVADVVRA